MRKEATLEQWEQLYEVAIRIKALKPWLYLWDTDLVTVLLPKYPEPFFCSVMGKAGDCFAIGTYAGYDALEGFYYIAHNPKVALPQLIRYQNNLMLYLGDREELTKSELQIIKDLGIKFRGKNEWIYFRSFETGYVPHNLDQPQVVELTYVLQQLLMVLDGFIENKIAVDFEKGEVLFRRFDKKTESWLNFAAPKMRPPRKCTSILIEDELLIAKLAKLAATDNEIELDTLYLNAAIEDKEFDKPFLANLLIIADRGSGMIVNQTMLTPKDKIIDNVLGIFVDYLMQMGKPKTVYIRDEFMEDYLKDLCNRINITLKVKGKLKVLDAVEKELSRQRF